MTSIVGQVKDRYQCFTPNPEKLQLLLSIMEVGVSAIWGPSKNAKDFDGTFGLLILKIIFDLIAISIYPSTTCSIKGYSSDFCSGR